MDPEGAAFRVRVEGHVLLCKVPEGMGMPPGTLTEETHYTARGKHSAAAVRQEPSS
jgi:hypothetical protein